MIVLSSKGKIVNPAKMPGLAWICWAQVMWQPSYSTTGSVCPSPGGLVSLGSLSSCHETIAAAPASYFAVNSGIFKLSVLVLLRCGGDNYCVPRCQEVVVAQGGVPGQILPSCTAAFPCLVAWHAAVMWQMCITCLIARSGFSHVPLHTNSVKRGSAEPCPRGSQDGELQGETSIQGSCCGKPSPYRNHPCAKGFTPLRVQLNSHSLVIRQLALLHMGHC